MWWVGSRTAIVAAEARAAREVVGEPEYRDGVEVPPDERVTDSWAIPLQIADGRWVIPAYEGLTPKGVTLVEEIDWPEVPTE